MNFETNLTAAIPIWFTFVCTRVSHKKFPCIACFLCYLTPKKIKGEKDQLKQIFFSFEPFGALKIQLMRVVRLNNACIKKK